MVNTALVLVVSLQSSMTIAYLDFISIESNDPRLQTSVLDITLSSDDLAPHMGFLRI